MSLIDLKKYRRRANRDKAKAASIDGEEKKYALVAIRLYSQALELTFDKYSHILEERDLVEFDYLFKSILVKRNRSKQKK